MKDLKNKSFKKFYLYSSIAWIYLLFMYFVLKTLVLPQMESENWTKAIRGLISVILIGGVFGLPIIILFSLPIRLAEKIMNRIEEKVKKKDE